MPVHESHSNADKAATKTVTVPANAHAGAASAALGASPMLDELQRTVGNQALVRQNRTDAPGEAIQRSAHNHGCGCPSCSSMQNILSRSVYMSTEPAVQRSAAHTHGCNCPACSNVSGVLRRMPVAGATILQRQADARRTHASMLQPARTRQTPVAAIRPIISGGRVIQRHASWEHRALGDIRPDKLAKIGTWQNVLSDLEKGPMQDDEGASLLEHTEEVDVAGARIARTEIKHVLQQEINRLKVWQDPRHTPHSAAPGEAEKLKQDINDPEWQLHLVEIPNARDPHSPIVLTYGELNTLADFYGSVEELLRSNPVAVQNVVQSVRAQSFEQLLKIYMQLNDNQTKKAAKKELGVEELGFKGAFNITDAISGEVAQMLKDKKGQAVSKEGVLFDDKEETFTYTSTLARNACHFAPESWHAWATLHRDARAAAIESHTKREQAGDLEWDYVFQEMPPEVQKEVAKLRAESQVAANMAMLRNGFGDHYLQDSYAAGHLINKTQVMQWFVQYLDAHPEKWTYSIDTSWRQMQGMAYGQKGIADEGQYDMAHVGTRQVTGTTGGQESVSSARNPQSVENSQDQANIGWEQRFEMLGLKVPQSISSRGDALTLLLYLQDHSSMLTSWTWKELKTKVGPGQSGFFASVRAKFTAPQMELATVPALGNALKALVDDNIVFVSTGDRRTMGRSQSGDTQGMFSDDSSFELRKEYVPSVIGGGNYKLAAANAKGGDYALLRQDGEGNRLQGLRQVHA